MGHSKYLIKKINKDEKEKRRGEVKGEGRVEEQWKQKRLSRKG